MNETPLALMDSGQANRRILSKEEHRADFRRVEAASLKRKTRLASADGKRVFARCFYSFQASMYLISVLGRIRLPLDQIEQIELAVRTKLEEATTELNRAIDGAELLLKNHNIETVATYDTVPMEEEIGITSALGRRYFELIHKLDQAMPLLQTLEIEEVINEKQVQRQRSRFKRIVMAMSSSARNLSLGVRRRMNEAKAREDEENSRKSSRSDPMATSNDLAVPTHIEVAEAAVNDDVIEPGGEDRVAGAAINSDDRVMAEAAEIVDVLDIGSRASQL